MQSAGDDTIFKAFELAERAQPSPRKIEGDREVYVSRGLDMPPKLGPLVLSDFGLARFGHEINDEGIQLPMYRAPEVLLGMKWSYSTDICNVGVMVRILRA